MSAFIRLQSSDGDIIEITKKIALTSGTIKNMLEDCSMDMDGDVIVPLANVNTVCLMKFLEWADHHKDDSVSVDDPKDGQIDDISSWDSKFTKMELGELFQLLLVANYLHVEPLLVTLCNTIANMIKGKTPEQIRETFNIQNDLSPAEEEQIRRENQWCDEK